MAIISNVTMRMIRIVLMIMMVMVIMIICNKSYNEIVIPLYIQPVDESGL